MVKVIATDLDGTLLKPKRKFALVEKSNKNFIKEFYGDTVLVSGRDPKFCAKVCNSLKIQHNFIALNGAIIVKNGEVIYRQSMKKTALMNLLDYLNANYDCFEFLVFDKYDKIICYTNINSYKVKKKYLYRKLTNGRLYQTIKVNNKKVIKLLTNNTDIYKALIYIKEGIDDVANQLENKFNSHFEFFCGNHSIEISPKGVNKGQALKYLIDTTKVKYNEVFVVGDGNNDLSMFELFSNSFAIEDSSNKLKIKAKHTIKKFSDIEKYTKLNDNFNWGDTFTWIIQITQFLKF